MKPTLLITVQVRVDGIENGTKCIHIPVAKDGCDG